ncbi:MAG: NADH-quinone oxidoreductase subunit E [Chloroflexi bacterium]|nr:MAG: NADH-quinone oxidoreductase subunit E [Chloroflexota bacterium]MBL1194137.1 NADH-quinone oxidoreductase subunit E [Chloroflexota bacterium]NOH11430.1 NADH-quinone oxidoreductase subunit E [Chloroflexota bacterium]
MHDKSIGQTFKEYLHAITPQGRTMLLPALLEAQNRYNHISKEHASLIGKALRVPLADVTGVIEFYTLLFDKPTAETIIRVCDSPACSLAGSAESVDALTAQLNTTPNQATPDGQFFVESVPCLGMCEHAPAALRGEEPVSQATADKATSLISGDAEAPQGIIYGDERPLTARCGVVVPTSLEDYLEHDGFAGLHNVLAKSPEDVIADIKTAGLMGRGGAAFPTGIKWEGAANALDDTKYIVCNADESEPGTFKDRVILEEDPFSVLEGMLTAAYTISAKKGYIFIRGEYPRAQRIFEQVIAAAYEQNYLGKDIQGVEGFDFDLEMRSGAGAYICGEETALFEAIEGKRGFPRIKPPFPTTHGLFNKPTAINNVETLANVSLLMRIGPDQYRQYGTEGSPGPRLFCLSGDVVKPGVYEVTEKTTLRELIYEQAGGLVGKAELQAILFGGAAGNFITPAQLDLPLTFEDTRAAQLSLGSGVVMIFNGTRDIRQALVELGHFFAHESCGKCYPCQLGTQRQLEILERVNHGAALPGDLERLNDVGWTMTDASLCGLGQTAATAVLSAMEHWPELFEEITVSPN